jgi:hypothetical protein
VIQRSAARDALARGLVVRRELAAIEGAAALQRE